MKKLINFLIITVVVLLTIVLTFSFTSEKIITNAVSNVYTKDRVVSNIISKVRNKLPNLSQDKLRELQIKLKQSSDLDKISNKYLDAIILDILEDKKVEVDISTELKSMIDYITEDMSDLEKQVVSSMTDDLELDFVYDHWIDVFKGNANTKFQFFLDIYKVVTGTVFRVVAISLVVLLLISLAVMNKNLSKTLMGYSITSYASALIGGVITVLLNTNLDKITTDFSKRPVHMDFTMVYIVIALLVVLGTVLLISGLLTRKKAEN